MHVNFKYKKDPLFLSQFPLLIVIGPEKMNLIKAVNWSFFHISGKKKKNKETEELVIPDHYFLGRFFSRSFMVHDKDMDGSQ